MQEVLGCIVVDYHFNFLSHFLIFKGIGCHRCLMTLINYIIIPMRCQLSSVVKLPLGFGQYAMTVLLPRQYCSLFP
jgi:hypothetical protein